MNQFEKYLGYLKGFFPAELPIGMPQFNAFCDNIFAVYGIPNLPSYRSAIATQILHIAPTTNSKAPYFFAKSIRKAQANEVAFSYLDEQRKEQGAKMLQERQALQAAKAAETEQQALATVTPITQPAVTTESPANGQSATT